jgi:hypothetical protein
MMPRGHPGGGDGRPRVCAGWRQGDTSPAIKIKNIKKLTYYIIAVGEAKINILPARNSATNLLRIVPWIPRNAANTRE